MTTGGTSKVALHPNTVAFPRLGQPSPFRMRPRHTGGGLLRVLAVRLLAELAPGSPADGAEIDPGAPLGDLDVHARRARLLRQLGIDRGGARLHDLLAGGDYLAVVVVDLQCDRTEVLGRRGGPLAAVLKAGLRVGLVLLAPLQCKRKPAKA